MPSPTIATRRPLRLQLLQVRQLVLGRAVAAALAMPARRRPRGAAGAAIAGKQTHRQPLRRERSHGGARASARSVFVEDEAREPARASSPGAPARARPAAPARRRRRPSPAARERGDAARGRRDRPSSPSPACSVTLQQLPAGAGRTRRSATRRERTRSRMQRLRGRARRRARQRFAGRRPCRQWTRATTRHVARSACRSCRTPRCRRDASASSACRLRTSTPPRASAPAARQHCGRRGQRQRAGAGHDQHRDRDAISALPESTRHHSAAASAAAASTASRNGPRRAVGQLREPGLLQRGASPSARRSARSACPAPERFDLHLHRRRQVVAARQHARAAGPRHGPRLAGQQRLVDRGVAGDRRCRPPERPRPAARASRRRARSRRTATRVERAHRRRAAPRCRAAGSSAPRARRRCGRAGASPASGP